MHEAWCVQGFTKGPFRTALRKWCFYETARSSSLTLERTYSHTAYRCSAEGLVDLSGLPPVPEPEILEPITDWRAYLDDCVYDFRQQTIDQTIIQILSRNLDSGHDTLDSSQLPAIDPKLLSAEAPTDVEELSTKLIRRIRDLARTALLEYDGQADTRQEIILRVLHEHISRRLTGGVKVHNLDNAYLLQLVWHLFDQVKANFYNPRLVASILAAPPLTEEHEEPAGHALRPA